MLKRIALVIQSFLHARSNSTAVLKNVAIRAALLGLNFCTGVLVARSLGPTGRGEQAAIGLWPPFIATLATLGIPTALSFHSRRSPERASQYYMSSAITMLFVGLITSGIGVLAMPVLLHGYSSETIRAAQWLMLFAPETLVASSARAYLESQNQFTRSTLGFFYPAIATLIGLAALRLTSNLTPLTGALCYLIPPAVQAVWIVSRLWESAGFRVSQLRANVRILLPYGLQCYGIDIINALSGQMDLVIIVAFLSPAELGLYTVALSLSRVMNIVQSSVVTILFSRASALSSDDAIKLVGRAGRLSTVAAMILGVLLIAVANFAVPIVYGSDFVAALPVLVLLVGETILSSLVMVHFQAFMATGRPLYVTIIEAIWTGTAIGLLYLLVPRMNLTGAATALLLAAVVRLLFTMLAYRIVLHRALPSLIPNTSDIAYLLDKFATFRLRNQARSSEQAAGNVS